MPTPIVRPAPIVLPPVAEDLRLEHDRIAIFGDLICCRLEAGAISPDEAVRLLVELEQRAGALVERTAAA